MELYPDIFTMDEVQEWRRLWRNRRNHYSLEVQIRAEAYKRYWHKHPDAKIKEAKVIVDDAITEITRAWG